MKYLWKYIDNKNLSVRAKKIIAPTILCIISAFIGAIIWFIIKDFGLSSLDWLVCFMGYPATISFFVGNIYASNHEFKS